MGDSAAPGLLQPLPPSRLQPPPVQAATPCIERAVPRAQVQLHSYLLDLDWVLDACPALGGVPKVLGLQPSPSPKPEPEPEPEPYPITRTRTRTRTRSRARTRTLPSHPNPDPNPNPNTNTNTNATPEPYPLT